MFKILAATLTTVPLSTDLGRYVAVRLMSDKPLEPGVRATFFLATGRTVEGTVVDMTEEIECGRFPDMSDGFASVCIIDTRPPEVRHKRMMHC